MQPSQAYNIRPSMHPEKRFASLQLPAVMDVNKHIFRGILYMQAQARLENLIFERCLC